MFEKLKHQKWTCEKCPEVEPCILLADVDLPFIPIFCPAGYRKCVWVEDQSESNRNNEDDTLF